MTQKIALAIIHGIGNQDPHFADGMKQELLDRFGAKTGLGSQAGQELIIEPVYWAPVLQSRQKLLWNRVSSGADLDFVSLRKFMVEFAADAIAYQPLPGERSVYEEVHGCFAESLKKLAAAAGPDAPLCVIAHSLGTVIASNYFYDLQASQRAPSKKSLVPKSVQKISENTPLEDGETLTWLFTMGSPIAIWSLRYKDFGRPVQVPAPKLRKRFPQLRCGWANFYDEDDVIGYPLKTLNADYRKAILYDEEVNAGGLLSSWNPLSHNGYWTDNDVTKPIAEHLAQTWKDVQPAP